jgi:hypothetical protein
MNKKICDICKKVVANNYVNLNLRNNELSLFKVADVCEKCFGTIPQLIKSWSKEEKSLV